jgi:hypothetical protein
MCIYLTLKTCDILQWVVTSGDLAEDCVVFSTILKVVHHHVYPLAPPAPPLYLPPPPLSPQSTAAPEGVDLVGEELERVLAAPSTPGSLKNNRSR